ncbi:hypothetical protein VE00_10473 [Pseudogymnoascus sp. WSF 3629]|nr:hypothetical protein VE00_10473 [Pseudogymnoascus sp. WSF 3629]
MGCSNPHPHGQIWTTTSTPEEPAQELTQLQKYRCEHAGQNLLADYAKLEMEKGERVVFQNAAFLVSHRRALVDLSDAERLDFAEAIAEAPLEGTEEEINASHLHMHFYPPLLRSATVRKFLVGYELLAEPQRDITPEQVAEKLRNAGGELYRNLL